MRIASQMPLSEKLPYASLVIDNNGSIDDLKEKIGIKPTIRDYGIDENDFLTRLDEMVEQAFDDQCTGANPRYPLMKEIKQMYLSAYYGAGANK